MVWGNIDFKKEYLKTTRDLIWKKFRETTFKIVCQLWSDKRGVKYFKKSRTKFQEKSRKNQKEKSKAEKPKNPLKQNQTYHRKNKK